MGAFGAPLLTGGFLRTPGYNWVNLVGLMLACTGAVLAVMLPRDDRSFWRSCRAHTAAARARAGMWFTVPAKPSSAPLFVLVALAFVAPRLRRRTGRSRCSRPRGGGLDRARVAALVADRLPERAAQGRAVPATRPQPDHRRRDP